MIYRSRRLANAMLWLLPVAVSVSAEPISPTVESVVLESYGLEMHFREPMLTWLGNSTPPGVSIDPPLDCRWTWTTDTILSCYDREKTIQPASTYQVRIESGLWTQQGEEISSQVTSVDSPRPEIDYVMVDHWEGGVPVIKFSTNMPVSAVGLHAALTLTEDDRAVRFKLIPASDEPRNDTPSEYDSWLVDYSPADSEPHSVSLKVRPGLQSSRGPLTGTQDKVALRAFVNESFRLRQVGCSGSYPGNYKSTTVGRAESSRQNVKFNCPAGQQLVFDFSRPLSEGSLASLREHLPGGLRFEKAELYNAYRAPGMELKEMERPGQRVHLVAERANRRFKLQFPNSLTSDDGAPLDQSVDVVIGSTNFLANMALAPAQMLVPLGSKSPELLSLLNLSPLKLSQTELGSGSPSKRSRTLTSSRKNVHKRVAPPRPSREIRNSGGLVEGVVSNQQGVFFYPDSYAVAYAAFNVTVSKARSQFLVWATSWEQVLPVADAQVEILRLERSDALSVVDSGKTDTSGVAVFDAALDPEEIAKGSLFVRVTAKDGQRAVVPLVNPLDRSEARERDNPYSMPQEGGKLDWGVTDRPIYRRGDTVRYRLWTRQREENRLRPLSNARVSTVRLSPQWEGTQISEYEATQDSYGSITGEFRLPESIHDNNYCISSNLGTLGDSEGACFRVAGYHLNNLWVELGVDRPLARNGDTVTLDAVAGYFSGGPAAGARTEFQSLLTPMRLEDAYPEFQSFTFIDPYEGTAGDGGNSLLNSHDLGLFTDASGHTKWAANLFIPDPPADEDYRRERPIPFGNLNLTATVSTSASNWASAPATMRFSRYSRFIGLKVSPWVLDDATDPQVEAVVITDSGLPINDAHVHIDIVEVSTAIDGKDQVVGSCELRGGQKGSCPFRPRHSGLYRFLASSNKAASTSVNRYASVGNSWLTADTKATATLTVENNRPQVGTRAELMLQQPFAKALVLVSVEHGRVLKHWVEHADSMATRISVPVESGWAPGVTINTIVLDAGGSVFGSKASPTSLVRMASVDLRPTGGVAPVPLELTLDRTSVGPGEIVQIGLQNPRSTSVQVTLAIVDDAARALGPEFVEAANPAGDSWLGKLKNWDLPDWYSLGSWQRQLGGESPWAPIFIHFASEIDPASGIGTAADSERLDTIVVTGSNIRAVDVFQKGTQADHSLGRPAVGASSPAALRNRFAESALWNTDIVLEPGARQSIDLQLPDNLTRWRILAWAADADDGFTLSESTIESSLPIEIRNETPTRLYPGDRARIGASVRAHGNTENVHAQLRANGAGVDERENWRAEIAANTQREISVTVQPGEAGEIAMETIARTNNATDGIGAVVEVASPAIHQHIPVAGWLPEDGVHLRLPSLPGAATGMAIELQASRGLGALAGNWVEGLRDYPHRCWEQILSRAVGAAAAMHLGITESTWPDAAAVVDDALHVAGQFQDSSGAFHFFAGQNGWEVTRPSLMLTAYSVQAFEFLRAMGYEVPARLDEEAREVLADEFGLRQSWRDIQITPYRNQELAAAAAATGPRTPIPAESLDNLWTAREQLGWVGQANLAKALAVRPDFAEKSLRLVDRLKQAGTKRGMARSIEDPGSSTWPFESRTLDQCAVLSALWKLDTSADSRSLRVEYLRGLADLFGGGASTLDTQASAQCLMTLVELQPEIADLDIPVAFEVSGDGFSSVIELMPGQSTAAWSRSFSQLPPQLALGSNAAGDTLLSFVASVEYDLDGRQASPTAVGFSLEREYSVIRNHAWKDASAARIDEGEWVRVTLRLTTSRMRRFVAVSDSVPGGLRPTDLELSGVADAELLGIQTSSSPWFPARQVDDLNARFYSEQVPPGTHEIYYYTRATHSGQFTALPAVAELMYGSASVSNTSSATIEIGPETTNQHP